MGEIARIIATGAIWVGYTLLGIALFWMALASGVAFFFLVALGILGVLTLVAALATSRVWHGGQRAATVPPLAAETGFAAAPRKAKRDVNARLARLIEQLDEDELLELETLLQAGEEDAILR